MNYKLAKQLKDAGFPQKLMAGDSYYSLVGHPRLGIPHQEAVCRIFIDMPDTASLLDDLVKIPTLEELIEWCGGDFYLLRKQHNSDLPKERDTWWKAESRKEEESTQAYAGANDKQYITRKGKTPSISMALLGLKLHKK